MGSYGSRRVMASFAGDQAQAGTRVDPVRRGMPSLGAAVDSSRLAQLHARLGDHATEQVAPLLARAYQSSTPIVAAAGGGDAADRLAAAVYASAVLVALAAEGELDATDTRITVSALADARDESFASAAFDLFLRTTASPTLLELPPRVAAEIQLKLLIHLDIAAEASVWRHVDGGTIECVLALGSETPPKRLRSAAAAAIKGRRSLRLVSGSNLRSVQVRRFSEPAAAIVIQVYGDPRRDVSAYLEAAAAALTPVLERELLLERNAARENALVAAGEKRLMRLGFDLHDGPIQDVLALKGEVHHLRDQIYPFVLESHRALAVGRFEDMLGRLTQIDLGLRELSHSLETKSIVSRPLSEIIHREVDAFVQRSGIDATVDVRGDPDTLSSAQRVAVFRAVQESLTNVREHSGATAVTVSIRARRSSIDVRVTDNGQGFEVSRSLARAAQRGRLGLVGMGERVRLLGGTFEIDSRPGGPTTLRFSLPRWEPLTPGELPRR